MAKHRIVFSMCLQLVNERKKQQHEERVVNTSKTTHKLMLNGVNIRFLFSPFSGRSAAVALCRRSIVFSLHWVAAVELYAIIISAIAFPLFRSLGVGFVFINIKRSDYLALSLPFKTECHLYRLHDSSRARARLPRNFYLHRIRC